MHQHQPDAESVQQGDVVHQFRKARVGHRLAAEGDDEGASAMGVDIGRGLAHPVDEGVACGLGVVVWAGAMGPGGHGSRNLKPDGVVRGRLE
jgi:hypothetical protein